MKRIVEPREKDVQVVSDFKHLRDRDGLTVFRPAPCFEIRGRNGQKSFVATDDQIRPGETFSVRRFFQTGVGNRSVVFARISIVASGKKRAGALIKAVNIQSNYLCE